MKKWLTVLLALISPFLFGQSGVRPIELVQTAKQGGESFKATSLFVPSADRTSIDVGSIDDYALLDLQTNGLQQLLSRQPESLTLSLPAPQGNIELELVRVDLFDPAFQVIESSTNLPVQVELGVHYRGIIRGDATSIAAMSFFENEVMGLYSSSAGNYVLGKVQDGRSTAPYILYNDKDVLHDLELDCATEDDGHGYTAKELADTPGSRALTDCVRFYFEVDYDIYQNKGGTTGATNYVTGLYNQVGTLYANESINTSISEIFVWSSTSPYSSTSSSGMLSQFQNYRTSWNGDLGQLLSYQASGGIAAGFAGICASNRRNSMSFSSIDASYATVPTYSWSVMVVTHEFGHTFGSRHTHACVWNGNNTAIDGCAGAVEGTCSLPGYPSGGGTIMSYCHLQSVGINFNNGFGSQPGNVIRNSVTNGSCLSPCGAAPTCSDGIQNQGETGVDCGGPCPACSCTGPDVTLTLVFDNYPEETSWAIMAGGLTYASGGPYGSQADGSTLVITTCLNDGCYDFVIYDSYGDGMCCSYGNGSYTLRDEANNILASGGSFTTSQTTNFCISGGGGDTTPPTAPTNLAASNTTTTTTDLSWNASTDNVGVTGYNVYMNGSLLGSVVGTAANVTGLSPSTTYSFYVRAYDAASNESNSSNTVNVTTLSDGGCTPATLGSYSYESNLQGWSDGGADCARVNYPSRSWDGSYSVRIQDNSGTSSSMTSPAYDLSEYSSVEVEFYFYSFSMENGEDFWVRYNSGSGWTTVATYARGTSFNNNTFYVATVTLNAGTYNLSSNAQFRFQCDASADNDQVYIDLVTINGNCSALPETGGPIQTIAEVGSGINPGNLPVLALQDGAADIRLYPNPAQNELNLAIPASTNVQAIKVYNANGAEVNTVSFLQGFSTLDISRLNPGVYFLSIQSDGEVVNKKFIKQ